MKTIPIALRTHFAQSYQTTATCWRLTLADSTVKAFTDHDRDLVIGGVTYLAASGYVGSNVVNSDSLDVPNLEVKGMLLSPSITEEDLRAGRWDFAAYEIFMVNWADLTMGADIKMVGNLGEVSTGSSTFAAELLGLLKAYARVIGEVTTPTCAARLGDARCQVDLYPFTVTGTVDSVHTDNMTFTDAARTEAGPLGGVDIGETGVSGFVDDNGRTQVNYAAPLDLFNGQSVMFSDITVIPSLNGLQIVRDWVPSPPPFGGQFYINQDISGEPPVPTGVAGTVTPLGNDAGYFDYGVLEWLTGDNAGQRIEVKSYVPGQFTIVLPMPYAIQVGDNYTAHAGCDGNLLTCRDRFNNVVNFRGFPYVPGMDRIIQVGRRA